MWLNAPQWCAWHSGKTKTKNKNNCVLRFLLQGPGVSGRSPAALEATALPRFPPPRSPGKSRSRWHRAVDRPRSAGRNAHSQFHERPHWVSQAAEPHCWMQWLDKLCACHCGVGRQAENSFKHRRTVKIIRTCELQMSSCIWGEIGEVLNDPVPSCLVCVLGTGVIRNLYFCKTGSKEHGGMLGPNYLCLFYYLVICGMHLVWEVHTQTHADTHM